MKTNRNRRAGNGRQKKHVPNSSAPCPRKLLVLHGSRQTGQLLLGRMDKLRKRLLGRNIQLVAPDAPFEAQDDAHLRQWWERYNNDYRGLDQSMDILEQLWKSDEDCSFEGILGFSQGARLAHLIAMCHAADSNRFPNLRYVILVSGYMAPLPDGFHRICPNPPSFCLELPSLHVLGLEDTLITPDQSRALSKEYQSPQIHEHNGKHCVPVKATNVDAYEQFIESVMPSSPEPTIMNQEAEPAPSIQMPDEETAQVQQDEVEALNAIFPEEFQLLSTRHGDNYDAVYEHPISYRIALIQSDMGIWPPHPVALRVCYPPTYPLQTMADISLEHENNMMEFTTPQTNAIMNAIQEAAQAELGMPSVLGCVYAAREFFESGVMATIAEEEHPEEEEGAPDSMEESKQDTEHRERFLLKPATAERIHECNLQGLEIAESLLGRSSKIIAHEALLPENNAPLVGKGGQWKYCIGLVGKPSAGKSTFFNCATAFARQRGAGDDAENDALGGATMAPHPFTTIDPNVGYCLVPAPPGSCPEEDEECGPNEIVVGSTHGRDSKGRRLVPVMLKDVAGLVPGAYQGRGRGNKFLNDLTDADVLIHVMDASGTADTEGNTVGCTEDGSSSGAGSHPLNDLAWIRNELIEWVYTNLMFKWDTIKRRGRNKLSGMFSGYGQSEAVLWDILLSVERYLDKKEQRDHALDHLDEWDAGDVHRLVSAFLGVRFPMALALNKCDLRSSSPYINDVQDALPLHGAHIGVPLSARSEMNFVRHHLETTLLSSPSVSEDEDVGAVPVGVWQCLHSAITLREPVLAFPVCDMVTYAPLPGLKEYATGDASLPSPGMIACLNAAGGSAPSMWNAERGIYDIESQAAAPCALRDVIVMKPGSTVEDFFLVLKRMGALDGEFVRAEGAGRIGEKAKLVPKHELVGEGNRILKIMTNKRREWRTK